MLAWVDFGIDAIGIIQYQRVNALCSIQDPGVARPPQRSSEPPMSARARDRRWSATDLFRHSLLSVDWLPQRLPRRSQAWSAAFALDHLTTHGHCADSSDGSAER